MERFNGSLQKLKIFNLEENEKLKLVSNLSVPSPISSDGFFNGS